MIIPLNHGNTHWTAAAINFRRKRIESYDSLGMYQRAIFKPLRDYLQAEHMDKKKKPFDFSGWVDFAPDVCDSDMVVRFNTDIEDYRVYRLRKTGTIVVCSPCNIWKV